MKLNTSHLLIIIATLCVVIVAGALHIAMQNVKETTRFTVESILPEGTISQRENLTFAFSDPVVDNRLLDKDLDYFPIEFTPAIPGKFRWVDSDRLRFFPEVTFAPSTIYTAKVSPTVSHSPTRILSGKRTLSFATERFKVKESKLSFERGTGRKSRAKIRATVEFNYPVDPTDLKEKLTLSYEDGKAIAYQPVTDESSDIIDIETVEIERSEEKQRFVLKLGKDFTCVNGAVGLKSDYINKTSLAGRGHLIVENARVRDGGGGHYLEIRFNSRVAPDQAQLFLTVEPEDDYQLVSNRRHLRIEGEFEPGERRTVKIGQGLSAQDGTTLKRNFSRTLTIPNLQPNLRFVGGGLYLPRDGNLNLGLATVNINSVQVDIEKVYANNLVILASSQRWSRWANKLGKSLRSEEIRIKSVLNEEVTTPISLAEYLADDRIGIFKVTARELERRWRYTTQWVMVTDLGIMAKKTSNELWVWVNSLSTLKGVDDAVIEVVSDNNQTLLSGTTNSDGVVKFASIPEEIEGFVPFMITAAKGKDLSFIELNRRKLSTTNFDVTGSPYLESGYEAFVYADRGIYRPGEMANLVSIVRGKDNLTPPSVPVLMQVLAPDKRIFREFRAQTGEEGAFELNVKFPEHAKTGGYIAKTYVAGREIGRASFQVEEFMPDRIKVVLTTDKPVYAVGDEISIDAEAVNLFGPPAVNRKVVASCDIEASEFAPKKWSSFRFSNAALKFKKRHINLGESRTDEFGKAAYHLPIPSELKPQSALSGIFVATVSEPGGRAVSAYRGVTIYPYTHYVGIRRSPEGYAKLNEEMTIEYISVDKDGIPAPERNLKLTTYKIRWNSILRRDGGGNYQYVSEKQAEILQTISLTPVEGIGRFAFAPAEYGEYRVVVRDLDSGASASTEFYTAGWGYTPWAMENPDRLEIDLDKATYQPGEIAKAQIKAPFSGKLILTVEREKVLSFRTVTMEENTAVIDVPIRAEYKPNVYLSASLIRSTTSLEKHAPARAFGVIPLKLNDDANRLAVEIDAVSQFRPNQELEVVVRVEGPSTPNREIYYLTVAAVDEGILQLTNFQTPDAHGFFFRQRGLTTNTLDLYSAVLPEVESASGNSSTGGGDGVNAARKKRLSTVSVTRVKPVSLWSGIVTTDNMGTSAVQFNVPQFNGTLRLMAVVFAGDRFGKAQKSVIVRDPIVLTPTFPRFVSGGDRFTVPVSVFNGTVEDGDFEIMLSREGAVEILGDSMQSIRLNTGEERQVFFELATQDAMGKLTFNLSAKGNRESTQMVTSLPLRPATPPVTQTGYGVVKAGREADFTFPSNYIAGTEEFGLTLSSFPAVKFAGGISYLLRYPYG